MWEDPDESRDTEPLNADVSDSESGLSSPVGVASAPPSEETNQALHEEAVIVSHEVVAEQDNAESPQETPPPVPS